jgi:hypothetical protein
MALSIILTVICIVCAVFCHHVARKRGRPPVFWGVMGFIFGPFALPFVLLLPDKNHQENTGN